jgi:hypothetical protein
MQTGIYRRAIPSLTGGAAEFGLGVLNQSLILNVCPMLKEKLQDESAISKKSAGLLERQTLS